MKKKSVALFMAGALIFGISVGSTMAWLTAETPEVKNTFEVGDINILLKEHDYVPSTGTLNTTEVDKNEDYHFVPGDTLPKDPFVTVKANSEDCYLFVKVEEQYNSCTVDIGTVEVPNEKTVNPIIAWTAEPHVSGTAGLAKGWKKHDPNENDGVEYWYRTVTKSTEDQTWYLLENNQVTVSEEVIKEMVTNINTQKPQLTFDAAAVQNSNMTLKDAWNQLPDSFRNGYSAPVTTTSGE